MSSAIYSRLRGLFVEIPNTTTAAAVASAKTPIAKSSRDPEVESLVQKFKNSSENPKFRRRFTHYEATVRRLTKSGNLSAIHDILEHQKKYPDITQERFAVRLIGLYGKAGMLNEAQQLFDEMPYLNCERTVVSFNALLGACLNSKKLDKITELFKELPDKLPIEPDIVSYNTVIKACCDMGSFDSAVLMMDKMEQSGIVPDVVTFNTLLDALYSKKRVSEAEKLWDLMEKKNVVPNVRSYNSRIRGFVRDNRVSDAVELIQEMEKKEMKLDKYSYNAMLKGFVDEGNLKEAKRWYRKMTENECLPDFATFGMLIPFACDKEDFDFAYELCKKAVRNKAMVYISMVQRVIDGLVERSKNDQAKSSRRWRSLNS